MPVARNGIPWATVMRPAEPTPAKDNDDVYAAIYQIRTWHCGLKREPALVPASRRKASVDETLTVIANPKRTQTGHR